MVESTWSVGGGGWIVLALVNAGLAEQKNRSRWIWFLVSLLLGPIATFLIVVWAAPEPIRSGESADETSTVQER